MYVIYVCSYLYVHILCICSCAQVCVYVNMCIVINIIIIIGRDYERMWAEIVLHAVAPDEYITHHKSQKIFLTYEDTGNTLRWNNDGVYTIDFSASYLPIHSYGSNCIVNKDDPDQFWIKRYKE